MRIRQFLQSQRNKRIVRVGVMIAIGVLVALTVQRALRMIQHDVTLELSLPGEMNQRLVSLEMLVKDPDRSDEVMALVQFRMPELREPARSWVHTLSLPRGTYQLEFFLQAEGSSPVRALRTLEVTASESIRIFLP